MFDPTRPVSTVNGPSHVTILPEPPGSRGTTPIPGFDVEKQVPVCFSSTSRNVSSIDLKGEKQISRPGIREYLLTDIDTSWTDLVLVLCGFISGLVDGVAFTYWNSFADMQTGNIIWAALGIYGLPESQPRLWIKALIAIAGFLLGTFAFILIIRLLPPRSRASLVTSFTLQTLMIFASAILSQTDMIPDTPNEVPTIWLQDLAIIFLSFQAAGQIIASKVLGYPEVPTVALTALMCDLCMDERLFVRPVGANPKRNRKGGFVLALLLGSIVAGGMSRGTGLAGGLWLAGSLKGGITIAFMLWRPKEEGLVLK